MAQEPHRATAIAIDGAVVREPLRAPGEVAERALVDRVLAGDRAAGEALIAMLIPVIQTRVARTLLRRSSAARGRNVRQELEDITQEVLLHLFDDDARALRAWSPARGLDLRNFVGLVAERQTATILRSGKRSPWTEDPVDDETLAADPKLEAPPERSPEALTTDRDLHRKVLERLRARVSVMGLRIFQLLIVDELSIERVTRETGMKAGAVYTWKSRLLKTIEEITRELEDETRSGGTP